MLFESLIPRGERPPHRLFCVRHAPNLLCAPAVLCAILAALLLLACPLHAATPTATAPPTSTQTAPAEGQGPALNCKSAVLMEATTGKILYASNAHEAMSPASVTKIMTLLLCMEAIDAGELTMDTPVTASAHAASMGGSQIYLKEGETMTARDMIKSVVIASANDAAVALAEHIAGSEEAFVARMNARARELGMADTNFENTNGLDDTATNHVTSAHDIAVMSRALIAHPEILTYSSIWMDTIRNGAFGLTNTNRLVRFYRGCNGLKTGSTQKAGFCISATACRDGMTLIAVIMGAESRDIRNAAATALLDWGFATYTLYTAPAHDLPPLYVPGGVRDDLPLAQSPFTAVVAKADLPRITVTLTLPEAAPAPIHAGEAVGKLTYTLPAKDGGEATLLGETPITAAETVERITFWEMFKRMLTVWLHG